MISCLQCGTTYHASYFDKCPLCKNRASSDNPDILDATLFAVPSGPWKNSTPLYQRAGSHLEIKLPTGFEVASPRCSHQWIEVPLFTSVIIECKLCGHERK